MKPTGDDRMSRSAARDAARSDCPSSETLAAMREADRMIDAGALRFHDMGALFASLDDRRSAS